MNGYLITLILLVVFYAVIFAMHRTGLMEKYNLSMMGPFLMWRTQNGKQIIERLSEKRFWFSYARLSKLLVALAMVSMLLLLLWEATIVPSIPKESAPDPEMMIGIPGINPVIPIGYGILGLVVAMVVHEGAHGILTRANKLKLKSLGILLMVVPLGAFVEPDEDELKNTTKKKRTDVFAVGPGTNILVAFGTVIIFAMLMMPSVIPVHDGIVITSVVDESPASHYEMKYGMEILSIGSVEGGGMDITSLSDLNDMDAEPGQAVPVTVFYKGDIDIIHVPAGLSVIMISPDSPAEKAGIQKGMILYSINGVVIHNYPEFTSAISGLTPDEPVNITFYAYFDGIGYAPSNEVNTITPVDRYEYYSSHYPSYALESDRGTGFLGISLTYFGAGFMDVEAIPQIYTHPFSGASGFTGHVKAALGYLALPFYHLSPINPPLSDLYTTTGTWSVLPGSVFWLLANSLYWIFWINLMVGLTNALPAIPLDGGYLFRDWMDSLILRIKKDSTDKQREKYISILSYIFSFGVLALILWQLVGPRLL